MTLRKIDLTVGGTPIGRARTFSYPERDGKNYEIPTYALRVTGSNASGGTEVKSFEVIRFGVHRKVGGTTTVVGLKDRQSYQIQTWIPSYTVHSATSPEMGAWQVFDDYLIHDGPDEPVTGLTLYATAGCIEICGGPFGFDRFNDHLIWLSGANKATRPEQLVQIGNARIMKITYEAAVRPALKEWV